MLPSATPETIWCDRYQCHAAVDILVIILVCYYAHCPTKNMDPEKNSTPSENKPHGNKPFWEASTKTPEKA